MWSTVLWFACFATRLVVSSAIPNNEVQRPIAQNHVVDALASPSSVRQPQSQKNETMPLGLSGTKWISTPAVAVLSNFASSTIPSPAPPISRRNFTSSSSSSGPQLSTHVEVSREALTTPLMIVTSVVDALSLSSTSAVINSIKSTSTFESASSASRRTSTRYGFNETWYQTSFTAALSSTRSTQDNPTTSPSLFSTPVNPVSYGTVFPATSSSGTFMVPSEVTVSSVPSPIKSQRPLHTAITSSGASHLLTNFTSNTSLSTSMSSILAVHSTAIFNSTAKSTKLMDSSDRTEMTAPYTSGAPRWTNSTTARSVMNFTVACDSTLSTSVPVPVSNLDTSTTPILAPHSSKAKATRSATTLFSPSGFATESAAASPPISPPLTASQTAGIAIAGTTGFLIALIATLYVARRYRNKNVRRTSNGSIYPKAAYLYDPPAGGAGDMADLEEPYIPCRTTDILVDGRDTTIVATPPDHNHIYKTVLPANQANDLGDPFHDSGIFIEYPSRRIYHSAQRYTDAVVAISTTGEERRAISKIFPTALTDASRSDVKPEMQQPGHFHAAMTGASRTTSTRSMLGEITSLAYSNDGYSNNLDHRSLPDSYLRSSHRISDVRETIYTDSWRDPFEHDLLLQVDTCSETPDSMAVFGIPTINDQIARSMTPLKARLEKSSQRSMASPAHTCRSAVSSHGITTEGDSSLDVMIAAPEHTSPAYNNFSRTRRYAADQIDLNSTAASVSPLAGAVHRGWDDIKRFSVERVVPSVLSLSTLQDTPSSSLRKKTSLFYL